MSGRRKGRMHLQETRGIANVVRLLSRGKSDEREQQRCRYVKTDYEK